MEDQHVKVDYVSIWDVDTEIVTPALLDIQTGEVFDIGVSDEDADQLHQLDFVGIRVAEIPDKYFPIEDTDPEHWGENGNPCVNFDEPENRELAAFIQAKILRSTVRSDETPQVRNENHDEGHGL